jgi:hypothetical protein
MTTDAKRIVDKYIASDGGEPFDSATAAPAELDAMQAKADARLDLKERIKKLAMLPPVEYDALRKQVAKELGCRTVTLDRLVQRERGGKLKPAAPIADIAALADSAAAIIQNENVLDLFAAEFKKVVAGERSTAKLLYLIATSRLLPKTMHAAVKGTSAVGKSEIRKRLLEFFPPESVVSFTSLSEKFLIYYDGDFAHKVLSMGEAVAVDEQSFQDYLLRELMSEGRIKHSTVQKVGTEIVATTIEKQGPVSFIVTTTKNKLHAENETRMLSLEIDDSEGQTRRVMRKVAQVEGLNESGADIDYEPWHNFQRWLEAGERRVVVPFASEMVELIPAASVRLRRDAGQVIRAIKAHALLHREQRERDEQGQIIADLDRDYAVVRALMNDLLAEGSGLAVHQAMAETVAAVRRLTATLETLEGASGLEVARALKLDKSAAWRRLNAAKGEGYLINLEQRRGMPGKYRVGDEEIQPVAVLPTEAELRDARARSLAEIAKTCNRDEIPQTFQVDTGCKGDLQPGSTAQPLPDRRNRLQTRLATDKPLNHREESLPVARSHDFGDPLGARAANGEVCGQCGRSGADGDPLLPVEDGETTDLYLHRACIGDWRDKAIPYYLDRRATSAGH